MSGIELYIYIYIITGEIIIGKVIRIIQVSGLYKLFKMSKMFTPLFEIYY